MPNAVKTEEANKRYIDLATDLGGDLALFCMCAVYNLPLNLSKPVPTWESYIERLENAKETYTFSDGVTDIYKALERGRTEEERWKQEWGVGDPDNPYTAKDYKNLDIIFRTYSARLEAAGGMDAQQEDTLRHCSRMALLRDKCVARGDRVSINNAQRLDKMIQDNLSSENLRKKDAKPIETAKADGIVDALQKKYGRGMELTKDQFLEIFFKWCHSKQYPETVDAAEQSLMAIINTTRANNDLPELLEYPEDVRKLEEYANEFADEPNEMEDEAYAYLHLMRGAVKQPQAIAESPSDDTDEAEAEPQKRKRGRPPGSKNKR